MNKTAINKFSVWARRKLISDITYKAGLIGISEKGILQPLTSSTNDLQFFDIGTGKPTEITGNEIKQRDALIKRIREKESTSDYKKAFQFVIEEVAYTWFNRLIAIRFMEVNDYLPSRIRVLSSETSGKNEPDMVTKPFETDMIFSTYETDKIIQLKDENKLDELFRMLFIKQCNKFNEILPALFEKTSDYTELLFNISFTDADGIVNHLIYDIEETDFAEAVEIIGWMYQYYNSEPKDEVFALLKKNIKITKERIPAATQLFTPDWIVRYMVENSLGRLWIEGHPNEILKAGWKYYLDNVEQEEIIKCELERIRIEYKKLTPNDIKIIDPCMGSGHILVYAFDLLMQIYESQGYTQRDAAVAIVENNLYGIDIDDRAYQLSYFAIMMKARKYDRRFLTRGIAPKVYAIKESNGINTEHLQYFGNSLDTVQRKLAVQQMDYLLNVFRDAKEYGSVLNIENCNWELLYRFVDDLNINGQITLDNVSAEQSQLEIKELVVNAEILYQKYDVVVSNPPYMGGTMNTKLANYLKREYNDVKSDLFATFIIKCKKMSKENGLYAMVVPESWMFLSTYNALRQTISLETACINLCHLGTKAFDCGFGTVAFVFAKMKMPLLKGKYIKLNDFQTPEEKEKNLCNSDLTYICNNKLFEKLPNQIMAYWCTENFANTLNKNQPLSDTYKLDCGIKTGNNDRYLRLWYEVSLTNFCANPDSSKLCSDYKWFKYNKGGGYQKWYGGYEHVIEFQNNANSIRKYVNKDTYRLRNPDNYFVQGVIWPLIGDVRFSSRYLPNSVLIDVASNAIYFHENYDYNIIAFMNTKVFNIILNMINPTVSYPIDSIAKVPYVNIQNDVIEGLAKENILISKMDWDSFEISWDFITHPLITYRSGAGYSDIPINKWQYKIADAFKTWESNAEAQFNILRTNEEKLNQIFIELYGLQDELTPEVDVKDVTISKANLQKDIKSFISYAVGCMFGRYSLDFEGLVYAGGEWNDNKYCSFIPDKDNCIPITDEEYFEDDIVGLFVVFVKKVYGEGTLEENLDFIANVLGNKGNTSRDIIRNYFVKDFYKDHLKTYQKRPIYWLYDSGKNDGFKGIIYMHRYNPDTTGIVRVDYLHKMQKIYMNEIERMQEMVANSANSSEVTKAEKRKEKLVKQLKETKEYDEKIAHLAVSRIAINLDDGIKVNYEKVQVGQDGKKLDILGKI